MATRPELRYGTTLPTVDLVDNDRFFHTSEGIMYRYNGGFATPAWEAITVGESVSTDELTMRKQCMSVTPTPTGPSTFESLGVYLNGAAEEARIIFRPPSYIDASADILITTVFRCNNADGALAMLFYLGCIKSDNSEAFSWNVESDTAVNLDSTNSNNPIKYEYTLANANYDLGDIVYMSWKLNEAERAINVSSVEVEFTITG